MLCLFSAHNCFYRTRTGEPRRSDWYCWRNRCPTRKARFHGRSLAGTRFDKTSFLPSSSDYSYRRMSATKVGTHSSWCVRKHYRTVVANVVVGTAGTRRCGIIHDPQRGIRVNASRCNRISISSNSGPRITTIVAHRLSRFMHFNRARA